MTAVTVEDFDFDPGVLGVAVPPGTSITWTNKGPTAHTTTARSALWDSGLLNAGESYSFTFNDPGVYWYFCRPHPWMRGTITLDPNAPAPASAELTIGDD
jgi:plastocyanin